jgi:hypothetical protein
LRDGFLIPPILVILLFLPVGEPDQSISIRNGGATILHQTIDVGWMAIDEVVECVGASFLVFVWLSGQVLNAEDRI